MKMFALWRAGYRDAVMEARVVDDAGDGDDGVGGTMRLVCVRTPFSWRNTTFYITYVQVVVEISDRGHMGRLFRGSLGRGGEEDG
jgi:hypothetical protein